MKNKYDKQAEKFLKDTGTTFTVEFLKHGKYFPDDKEERDIYLITLDKKGRVYSFRFGQSIVKSITKEYRAKVGHLKSHVNKLIPTAYDVLTCLTKYDPGTFEEFCSSFGYDEDSRKAEKIYKAVVEEWKQMQILFSYEELETMQKIQ